MNAVMPADQLAIRIIPCLDVTGGRVVKGINFVSLRDAGDPVELARVYDREGADELCFLDITASSDGREIMVEMVARTADVVSIPFAVGGGMRSVKDALRILHAGADKVAFNTAAVERPELLHEVSDTVGSQSVVAAIDARDTGHGNWEVYVHGGRTPTGIDVITWCETVVAHGAGEILLTSMDRDGTKQGFDTALLRAATAAVEVPVIASGGAGTSEHMVEAARDGNAAAVLAASIFHFGEVRIRDVKQAMADANLPVRTLGAG
ncbi:MAG: imidazole glycerol phosphate synthase subunit HisF [Nitriliruptoraceae bacterium]